MTYVATRKFLY